ncbi:MAG: hypothetical protein RSD55_05715 [Lachnospiraceae bacterium]
MKTTKKGLIIAAICIGLLVGIFATGKYFTSEDQYFALDINPSIEFKTNHLGKIASIHTSNADAEKLLAGYKGENKDVEVVIQEVLELLIANGYIGDTTKNDILISVENNDQSKELLERVEKSIKGYLTGKKVNATVISQKIDANGKLIADADKNQISAGKMALIEKIMAGDTTITPEELTGLRISDLLEFAAAKGMSVEDLVEKIDGAEDSYDSEAFDILEDELDDMDDADDEDDADDADDEDDADDADDEEDADDADEDDEDDADDADEDDADDADDEDDKDDADDEDDKDDADDEDDKDDADDKKDADQEDNEDDEDDDNEDDDEEEEEDDED